MFRAAQANPFDEAVGRATDENLTSENWEFILDVCDRVAAEDTGGKDAVAAMIKRLAHRNANVQLYTLELANALSQNCGIKVHKELASRSFTEAMLRLANDRTTHQQVKAKILERMAEWTQMFSKDPDLGIMEQAYLRLKSQNPSLQPPSKPFKREITDVDRQKEEEELQMALALSIKDKQSAGQAVNNQTQSASGAQGPSSQPAQAPLTLPSGGTTAATVSRVRAKYDFQPSEPEELQFRRGDIIAVLESVYKDWWKGSLRGQTGIFPLNYVEKLQDPTQEELMRDAQTEAEIFAEIRNVEKLLTLLSTSGAGEGFRENEEITELYHSTVAIRPKLIELIGKYSQKKDDFTQLNEKFIKARRDYEALLEASMSQAAHSPGAYGRHPPQHGYGFPPTAGAYAPHPQQTQDSSRYYQQQPQPGYAPQGAPPQPNGMAGQPPSAAFHFLPPGQQVAQAQAAQAPSAPPNEATAAQKTTMSPAPYADNRHSIASTHELAANNPPLHPQELQHLNHASTQPMQATGGYPPQQQPQQDNPYGQPQPTPGYQPGPGIQHAATMYEGTAAAPPSQFQQDKAYTQAPTQYQYQQHQQQQQQQDYQYDQPTGSPVQYQHQQPQQQQQPEGSYAGVEHGMGNLNLGGGGVGTVPGGGAYTPYVPYAGGGVGNAAGGARPEGDVSDYYR